MTQFTQSTWQLFIGDCHLCISCPFTPGSQTHNGALGCPAQVDSYGPCSCFSHHLGPYSLLMLPIKMEVAGIASSLTTLAYSTALESIVVFPSSMLVVLGEAIRSPMCCDGLKKLEADERQAAEIADGPWYLHTLLKCIPEEHGGLPTLHDSCCLPCPPCLARDLSLSPSNTIFLPLLVYAVNVWVSLAGKLESEDIRRGRRKRKRKRGRSGSRGKGYRR